MNVRRRPLSLPPGRGHEVAPEPAYIHCSWNVNNDQFCPHDRPEACRTKCEGVCGSVRGGLGFVLEETEGQGQRELQRNVVYILADQ
jgi:hypothetical protein